jgi:predicted nucleic-acid-binding protein
VTAFVDTNVLVRHLTGDPPEQAGRASRFLAQADELARAIIAVPAVVVLDPAVLLRAIEVYELHRLDFAESYLVAQAERSGRGADLDPARIG